MQMKSIWTETVKKQKCKPLQGNAKTDVLIIGGGLAGILCAYQLKMAGVDTLLIEADEIGQGVTAGTTAKVTVQHGLIYQKIAQTYGIQGAKQYYRANAKALETYKELAGQLDFDFEEQTAYIYHTHSLVDLRKELAVYKALGMEGFITKDTPLPFPTAGALGLQHQGQLHPLKLLYALAENLNLCEHTRLYSLAPHKAITNRGEIAYQTAVVATHFPMFNRRGLYFLKLYQQRSYVLALKGAEFGEGMFLDAMENGLSFRHYGEYLLLGGGGHRTGKQGGGYRELERFAKSHFPHAKTVFRYATQDCMSLDGIPYVGAYSPATPHLLVATGFNKWGFTNAMAASEILRDNILGKPNENAEIFAPNRSMLHKQLLINSIETVTNFITPKTPRCPHLGCALHYNKQEHSWDCACHGSRFDTQGTLLNNPAKKGIAPPKQ